MNILFPLVFFFIVKETVLLLLDWLSYFSQELLILVFFHLSAGFFVFLAIYKISLANRDNNFIALIANNFSQFFSWPQSEGLPAMRNVTFSTIEYTYLFLIVSGFNIMLHRVSLLYSSKNSHPFFLLVFLEFCFYTCYFIKYMFGYKECNQNPTGSSSAYFDILFSLIAL